ncbi:IucA/IucC family siderophore biosynthesis protein [Roseateles sp. DAIF2]|uniref:IucA/IucC family protein n=1 Tax=Roseateles sp. DAIF2 TaxID=2714952 RepID=UPI0018A30B48|nr:IucA/IucC family siderophore biosynthesis protein [Roseateles sp. DAIF2]QPF72392.1 IucA/IucC family siderophore biosynthesis protein [Roseateles sp. DAIF2]
MNVQLAHQFAADPAAAASHLTPEVWAQANRLLLRKAIAEYAHELIVEPQALGPAADGFERYRLASDDGRSVYEFEARRLALRHWFIRAESLQRRVDGAEQALDALQFIIECRQRLGIREELLPIYLDEISSTLFGSAYKRNRPDAPSSEQLVDEPDFQRIEAAMIEGHPGFVANNGRLGFTAIDYRAYAPETGSELRVLWLAVHKEHASFASISSLSQQQLLEEELGRETLQRFTALVAAQGVDPADYHFMPAHPWQWFNKLSIAFAGYVAQRKIICLDYSEDRYTAQQSIRTYFNQSDRRKRYVKTSLSILNMGFMRGLSPYYMSGTPAINEYIKGLVDADPVLRAYGFTMLQEVASIGFRNFYYEAAIPVDTPYKKMFSALWRESPLPLLKPGERLMTMAALLHVDKDGRALLPALIRRSGLAPEVWLRRYLDVYLTPLLHCFYRYELTFMPHGENLILVLDECHAPVRAIMKDIAEECAILNLEARQGLPEKVERLAVDVPEHFKILGIFIDVFDGVLRHINQVLVEHGVCDEDAFWSTVADSVSDYQQTHPELAAQFARYDIFAPEFLHSCLNRLQLGNNVQMVNLADPASSLKMAGNLPNPIARFRRAPADARRPAPDRVPDPA